MGNIHPATGPITPEQMRALADAPFGKAEQELRKHDPLFGKLSRDHDEANKAIGWKVFVTKEIVMEAFVTVIAVDEDEAIEIAEAMRDKDIKWEVNHEGDIGATFAEPA